MKNLEIFVLLLPLSETNATAMLEMGGVVMYMQFLQAKDRKERTR